MYAIKNFKVLFLSLIFFFLFQVLFNIKDFSILYIISKAVTGAIGVLVFLFFLLNVPSNYRLPEHSGYLILLFCVLMILSATTSHMVFGQPFFDGVVAQLKLFGIFYYFLALVILYTTNPDVETLKRTFVFLGIISLIIYTLINIFINAKYVYEPGSSIVIKDSKGYRFKLPDVFIVIYLFYCLRNYIAGKQKFLMISVCLLIIAYLLFFQRERAEFLCIGFVFLLRVFKHSIGFVRVLFILIFASALVFFVVNPDIDQLLDVDTSSLQIREITSATTFKYVSSGIPQALFGAGNLNSLWNDGFARLYGENFSLSDIGWMGVVFEFGITGAIFCFITYLLIIKDIRKTEAVSDHIILKAFRDYIIVRLFLSILSPHIPYFIGIYMTILAISVYLRKKITIVSPKHKFSRNSLQWKIQ